MKCSLQKCLQTQCHPVQSAIYWNDRGESQKEKKRKEKKDIWFPIVEQVNLFTLKSQYQMLHFCPVHLSLMEEEQMGINWQELVIIIYITLLRCHYTQVQLMSPTKNTRKKKKKNLFITDIFHPQAKAEAYMGNQEHCIQKE